LGSSFIHAGAYNNCKVKVVKIHSEVLEKKGANYDDIFHGLDGVLVAPGFGERGVEGKIRAIQYVRENNIPFFGICLGMQCAAVEFARNVLGIKKASSTEVKPKTTEPIIDLMPEQKNITAKGGTMRLGSYDCKIEKGTKAYDAYGNTMIQERHRHRYEFNNEYLDRFKAAGMIPSGINPDTGLVEVLELENHPWFVGVQFHPELKSTVEVPSPVFMAFVAACKELKVSDMKSETSATVINA